MTSRRSFSQAEKLLVAASELTDEGRSKFTAEDLVVRAFELYASDFALKGYPHYPDSKPVVVLLSGKKSPLLSRGWLEKVGSQQYRLTPAGSARLTDLDVEVPSTSITTVERKQEEEIGRLVRSQAYRLFESGQESGLTFHHFTRFVGLSPRDQWRDVEGRIEAVEHVTKEAMSIGESGQMLRVHYGGRNLELSSDQLRTLHALLDHMLKEFRSELDQWRRKSTER